VAHTTVEESTPLIVQVTVPVGAPEPGAAAARVAVNTTGCPGVSALVGSFKKVNVSPPCDVVAAVDRVSEFVGCATAVTEVPAETALSLSLTPAPTLTPLSDEQVTAVEPAVVVQPVSLKGVCTADELTASVVPSWLTGTGTCSEELAPSTGSPRYRAVTQMDDCAAVRFVVVHVATPATRGTTTTSPAQVSLGLGNSNRTSPEGVPPSAGVSATDAVNVTAWPETGVLGEKARLVVVRLGAADAGPAVATQQKVPRTTTSVTPIGRTALEIMKLPSPVRASPRFR